MTDMTGATGTTGTAALPARVDTAALAALAGEFHARGVRAAGVHDVAGHLVKAYVIEAPGRSVTAEDEAAALDLAGAHLAGGRARGTLGLAVLLMHAGGDGDYVIVHSWIEGYMSDLAVFLGPAGRPAELRPGRTGLAPCVWEADVLAHERTAFARSVLDGSGPMPERLAAWAADVFEGDAR
ncbi:hypothetical protein [Yinghuangia soli]|uniref:Uncharacterized protein n=1 Tax=Yinghuangia soli TaxID=2908204 RepID=A0AA41Q8B2_9ACTN|nr:hypothetical protein [Yinghuangia soli]MCF2532745.1 hypothetical protein [Yinghuangia soli]